MEKKGDERCSLANSDVPFMAAKASHHASIDDDDDNGGGKKAWDEDFVSKKPARRGSHSFLGRKIAAHIKKKSQKEKEAVTRNALNKAGEPMAADFVHITNNISLQMSRHTSRHSRYGDDSSTETDDDADSFFDDDVALETAEEGDEMEKSSAHFEYSASTLA